MIIAAPVVKGGSEMKAAVNVNAEMKAQLAPQNPLENGSTGKDAS